MNENTFIVETYVGFRLPYREGFDRRFFYLVEKAKDETDASQQILDLYEQNPPLGNSEFSLYAVRAYPLEGSDGFPNISLITHTE